jgi:hypothetical protein
MIKAKTLTGILGACLFLTIASSVRADVVHPNMDLEKLIFAENHNLTDFDIQRAETGYLYAGQFENNNGKHLGFSVTAVNRGPKLGIVRPQSPSSVSQNPEPTTMVLLGTGLAAVGSFARKKRRTREQ